MQFAHHIRKDIDMIGLICHLFGSQIGAVIIQSEVADSHGSIYSDLALNYTRTQRGQTRPGGGPRVVVSTAAFHARVRGSVPGLGGLKETKLFLPHPRVKVSIVGSLRD